jgi:hypothetical protein
MKGRPGRDSNRREGSPAGSPTHCARGSCRAVKAAPAGGASGPALTALVTARHGDGLALTRADDHRRPHPHPLTATGPQINRGRPWCGGRPPKRCRRTSPNLASRPSNDASATGGAATSAAPPRPAISSRSSTTGCATARSAASPRPRRRDRSGTASRAHRYRHDRHRSGRPHVIGPPLAVAAPLHAHPTPGVTKACPSTRTGRFPLTSRTWSRSTVPTSTKETTPPTP